MIELLKGVLARLDADAALTGTGGGQLGAQVFYDRAPDAPKALTRPYVVLRLGQNADRLGDHGGAVDAGIEVEIWGYASAPGADARICTQVAERLDELMLKRYNLGAAGQSARPGLDQGWQRLDDPDPLVVRLMGTYFMVYWSAARVAAAQ